MKTTAVASELILAHRPAFEHVLRATRSCYRVGDPLVLSRDVVDNFFDGLCDGPTGFLSIKSPEARIEVCTHRNGQVLVWDARYLDYLNAYTKLHLPRTDDRTPERSFALRQEAARNLLLLFLMEQLSLYGPAQIRAASEIHRRFLENDLTPGKILSFDFSHLDPNVPANRSTYADFVATGIRYFIMFHEAIHIAARRPGSTLVADASKGIDQMMEGLLILLAKEQAEMLREAGTEGLRREMERRGLTEKEVNLEDEINRIQQLANETWWRNAKPSTKEELVCDFFATERVFDKYVVPKFLATGDVGYLYVGKWIVMHYCESLQIFGALARLARSFAEVDRQTIRVFDPEAFARFHLLDHLYMRKLDQFFAEHPTLTSVGEHVKAQAQYWMGWFLRLGALVIRMLRKMGDERYWDSILAEAHNRQPLVALQVVFAELHRYLGWE